MADKNVSSSDEPWAEAGTCIPSCRCATLSCFPHMIVPLFVGREKSINALEEVMRTTSRSCSPRRRMPATTIRTPMGIYEVGTLANRAAAAQAARRHRQGAGRRHARAPLIVEYTENDEYFEAAHRTGPIEEDVGPEDEVEALARSVVSRVRELRQAQQEDLAGSARRDQPDRRLFQARRHGRLASGDQDPDKQDILEIRRSRSVWSVLG
jgi:ATP-dependent Lon protease